MKFALLYLIAIVIWLSLAGLVVSEENMFEDYWKYQVYEDTVKIEGRRFQMGNTNPMFADSGEYPPKKLLMKSFVIDKYPVTNSQYWRFQQMTGYKSRTIAQKNKYSYVFATAVTNESQILPEKKIPGEPWWLAVKGAKWSRPEGAKSTLANRMHYPVVHISHMDAETFCQWSGKRLPTEAEWEFAARGGLKGTPYPWGDDFSSKRTNLWQGLFPLENKMYDGYKHLSPVDAFEQQNTYGMYDVLGNTWEWTATPFQRGNIGNLSLELSASYPGQKYYVLKGASFIDFREETAHINHAARLSNRLARPLGFTSQNIGFRCAQDYKPAPRPPTIHTLPGKSDPEAPKVTVLLNRKEEL